MLQRPGSSWGFGALLKDTSVVVLKEERALVIHSPTNNPCRTWDSNPQPLDYKSDSLTIRPQLPLMWCWLCVLMYFVFKLAKVLIYVLYRFQCKRSVFQILRLYVCLLWERPTDGPIWNSCLVAPGPSPELPADFTPTPVLARHVTHPQSGTITHTCSIYTIKTLRHFYTRFDTTICTSAPIFTITGKLSWPREKSCFISTLTKHIWP